jgi:hypothetical protein
MVFDQIQFAFRLIMQIVHENSQMFLVVSLLNFC